MATFKKILCPTDFSEASYEGLRKAVELASDGATEICVVHVEQPLSALTPLAGIRPYAEDEAARRAETIKNLSEVLEERVPKTVRARPILKQGQSASEIVHVAEAEDIDLIVLTTHGACGWRPGVLGAVAEEVLRRASCPVLTISGPASDKIRYEWALQSAAVHAGEASNGLGLEPVADHKLYLDGD